MPLSFEHFKKELTQRAAVMGGLVALMALLELVDKVLPAAWTLDQLGIHPRTALGWLGLPFAPWLHFDFDHLWSNVGQFFALGLVLSIHGWAYFWRTVAGIALIAGLGIYAFGSAGVHLGASVLCYGFLGCIVARGYFDRRFVPIAIACVVGAFYLLDGIFGLLSYQAGVSFSGHLFGFLGGIAMAAWQARHLPKKADRTPETEI
jgi:membrane associated rhomboid family serine protease